MSLGMSLFELVFLSLGVVAIVIEAIRVIFYFMGNNPLPY